MGQDKQYNSPTELKPMLNRTKEAVSKRDMFAFELERNNNALKEEVERSSLLRSGILRNETIQLDLPCKTESSAAVACETTNSVHAVFDSAHVKNSHLVLCTDTNNVEETLCDIVRPLKLALLSEISDISAPVFAGIYSTVKIVPMLLGISGKTRSAHWYLRTNGRTANVEVTLACESQSPLPDINENRHSGNNGNCDVKDSCIESNKEIRRSRSSNVLTTVHATSITRHSQKNTLNQEHSRTNRKCSIELQPSIQVMKTALLLTFSREVRRKAKRSGCTRLSWTRLTVMTILIFSVFLGDQRSSAASPQVSLPRSVFSYDHEDHVLVPHFAENASVVCPENCVCVGFQVDCSGQNLTRVPKGIPSTTTYLDLSMNNFSTLPDNAFAHLTSLQELRLASNELHLLPKKLFRKNRFLSILYLQDNKFQSVPKQALHNLPQLQQLHLDANQIREVPSNCFKNLHSLKQLWLDDNNLTRIPSRALSSLVNLEAVTLALNHISVIPDNAFRNLSRLVVLMLHENIIRETGDYAFLGLTSLRILHLNKNNLTQMPSSLSHLENLSELNLEQNMIQSIPDNCFSRNRKLNMILLHKNPIRSIGTRAFANLPSLEKIVLSEVSYMFTFPDLNGTNNLTQIRLDRASIQVVPGEICAHRPKLQSFDIHSNKITMIPDFSSCSVLLNLNLGNNQLLTLEGRPFRGLTQLRDLTLSHNRFNHVPNDAFAGMTKLQYLDLAHNHIRTIQNEAFLPLTALEDLNLGDNQIMALPTQGLQNLNKLKIFDNENLRDFPPIEHFPKVYQLVLSYAYHCCDFLQAASVPQDTLEMVDEKVTWLQRDNDDLWPARHVNLSEFWTTHFDNHTTLLWDSIQNNEYEQDQFDISKEAELFLGDYKTNENIKNIVVAKPPVTCKPQPGPFMPCDDLFEWWSLRCGVWFVFMLALLGNAVVLFVSVTSRSKMDVPRFLICNLACADFCMGVYLGILAMVDASTLGEFRKHAIQWQISVGCLVAGFLGVLSSELSVFTLTVITLERFYAITHAMQLNKRLSLRQAGYIMLGGWLWSSLLASLPLFGISDYRKFAVCLPFEVEDIISKSYVIFILVFNGVSFSIILACYLCMYLSIRHSQAWNSNDTRVAKRMALLVFTDFLCWAPIAFFSLGAAFGTDFIDLSGAKVLTIFVLPLNSCANPFLYAIFTKQFKRDCVLLCRRLEDSSIARHFSRVSNRHVSLAWGSSHRASQLNSLMNGEKGGSCSRSQVGRRECVLCHSDPDSGKGSLNYEKVPQTEPDGCTFQESNKRLSGDRTRGKEERDYQTTNAYNEMLTLCGKSNDNAVSSNSCSHDHRDDDTKVGNDEHGQCGWQRCRDCPLALHQTQYIHPLLQQQHHISQSPGGSNSHQSGRTKRLSSDDYNCTNETYLPASEEDGNENCSAARGICNGCQRWGQHPQQQQKQQQQKNATNAEAYLSSPSNVALNCSSRYKDCVKTCGCDCQRNRQEKGPVSGASKKSRKDMVLPLVSFSKSGSAHVSIHVPHCLPDGPCSHCSDGSGAWSGGGKGCLKEALRCCGGSGSASSSPADSGCHPNKPAGSALPQDLHFCSDGGGTVCRSHDATDVGQPDPNSDTRHNCPASVGDSPRHTANLASDVIKAEDSDSGHGVGIPDGASGERGSGSPGVTEPQCSSKCSVEAGLDDPKEMQYYDRLEQDEENKQRDGVPEDALCCKDSHENRKTRFSSHDQNGRRLNDSNCCHSDDKECNRSDECGRGNGRVTHPASTGPQLQQAAGLPAVGISVVVSSGRQRVLDKSEHLRFFTDSLAAHPHTCRSNSLMELTKTSQAKISAPLHPNNPHHPTLPKRLSLTPRQEGYLLLNASGDETSPYMDVDDDAKFPSYEELQRYLQSSSYCANRDRSRSEDHSAAPRKETLSLLGRNAKDAYPEDDDDDQTGEDETFGRTGSDWYVGDRLDHDDDNMNLGAQS